MELERPDVKSFSVSCRKGGTGVGSLGSTGTTDWTDCRAPSSSSGGEDHSERSLHRKNCSCFA